MNMPYIFLQDAYFHFQFSRYTVPCLWYPDQRGQALGKHSVLCCGIWGHEGEILFLFCSLLFQFTFCSSNLGNENLLIWSYDDSGGSFAAFCQLMGDLQQGTQGFAPVNKESVALQYTS